MFLQFFHTKHFTLHTFIFHFLTYLQDIPLTCRESRRCWIAKPATVLATFSLYVADIKKSSYQEGGWQGIIGTPETPHTRALFNP